MRCPTTRLDPVSILLAASAGSRPEAVGTQVCQTPTPLDQPEQPQLKTLNFEVTTGVFSSRPLKQRKGPMAHVSPRSAI
jgi:hypothetical protein